MHCEIPGKVCHFGGKILFCGSARTTYIHHTVVLEADFVYGGGGDMTGEVLEEIWWWWGRSPLPPTQQTALSSSVDIMYNALTTLQQFSLLNYWHTFHTLCVSKRIQTYNTLGIHLQSVKISGISGISMSLHTNAQLEIFVFEPMRHNETNRISSLVYQWIPNYALIALNFTSRHRAWSMNNWSINPSFDVMQLPRKLSSVSKLKTKIRMFLRRINQCSCTDTSLQLSNVGDRFRISFSIGFPITGLQYINCSEPEIKIKENAICCAIFIANHNSGVSRQTYWIRDWALRRWIENSTWWTWVELMKQGWSQWNRGGVNETGMESMKQGWSQWNMGGVNETGVELMWVKTFKH